jgi:hypothetical protein
MVFFNEIIPLINSFKYFNPTSNEKKIKIRITTGLIETRKTQTRQ